MLERTPLSGPGGRIWKILCLVLGAIIVFLAPPSGGIWFGLFYLALAVAWAAALASAYPKASSRIAVIVCAVVALGYVFEVADVGGVFVPVQGPWLAAGCLLGFGGRQVLSRFGDNRRAPAAEADQFSRQIGGRGQ